MRFLLVLLVLAAAGTAAYIYLQNTPEPQTADEESLFNLCTNNTLNSGDAVSACGAFLSIENTSTADKLKAYRARAEAHTNQGRYADAVADYSSALELAPDDKLLLVERGDANGFLHQDQKAIADYTAAAEIDPTFARAFYSRGLLYRANANPEAALSDLTMVIRLDGNVSAAHYHRGLIYLSRGEMDAALADFDASIETAAFTFAEAHVQRALILAERAELDRAATDLETAYQFGPAPLVIQFERAAEARGHFTETPDAEYGEATKAAIPLCLADPDCRSTLAD